MPGNEHLAVSVVVTSEFKKGNPFTLDGLQNRIVRIDRPECLAEAPGGQRHVLTPTWTPHPQNASLAV